MGESKEKWVAVRKDSIRGEWLFPAVRLPVGVRSR